MSLRNVLLRVSLLFNIALSRSSALEGWVPVLPVFVKENLATVTVLYFFSFFSHPFFYGGLGWEVPSFK